MFKCPACKESAPDSDAFELRVEWRRLDRKESGKRVQIGYLCRSCMSLQAEILRSRKDPDMFRALMNVFQSDLSKGAVVVQESLLS